MCCCVDLYNVGNRDVSTYKWCCNCLAGGDSKTQQREKRFGLGAVALNSTYPPIWLP